MNLQVMAALDDDDGPPDLIEAGQTVPDSQAEELSSGGERKVPITIVTGMDNPALRRHARMLECLPSTRLPWGWKDHAIELHSLRTARKEDCSHSKRLVAPTPYIGH